MNEHLRADTAPRERKRRAIADYDAWVESDLRSGRNRTLLHIGVGVAIAATVIIGITRLWQGETPADKPLESTAQSLQLGPDDKSFMAELRELPLDEHVRVVRVAQRALEDRLLVGPAKWGMRLLGNDDGGVTRILNHGQTGLVSVPGGGAYFSFISRSQSSEKDPDIAMRQWAFHSGLAAGDVGIVVKVDRPCIDEVTVSVLPEILRSPTAASFAKAVRARPVTAPKAIVGGVYAVRSVRWGKSDRIAAFEVLDRGPYGISFVWALIERRPKPVR